MPHPARAAYRREPVMAIWDAAVVDDIWPKAEFFIERSLPGEIACHLAWTDRASRQSHGS